MSQDCATVRPSTKHPSMSAAYSLRHATDYNSKLSRPVQVNGVCKQHFTPSMNAKGYHTVLLVTRHEQTHPALGWYLIYLPWRDGRLS